MPEFDSSAFYVRQWYDPATDRTHLTAHNVTREADFHYDLLKQADGEHLIYEPVGTTPRIVLDVDNGRWVWQITGCTNGVIHGRWPD